MNSNKPNKYFAFISYKREDEEIAKTLQHLLEFYKLPIAVIEKEPDLKEGVRPIFVDMTELGDEPFLAPAIKKALEESRFLIVICSPRSAKSKWVNKEVQYFVKLKRTKRIIPFIIEGIPNAKVKEEECCTPTMQKLMGKRELLGINTNEMGFDAAVVKVVSRMFRLKFRSLWNRYEREKEEEQRKLKEQNDRLMIAQSRYVAEKAIDLAENDSYLARLLAIEVLPKDLKNPDRPYTIEAEVALRKSCTNNSAIFTDHTEQVNYVSFSPNGKYIASTSNDLTINIWKSDNGVKLNALVGHSLWIDTVVFSPDSRRVVSTSLDGHVKVWDIQTGQELQTIDAPDNAAKIAVFSPDGGQIFIESYHGEISVFDVETGEMLDSFKGYTLSVGPTLLSPDKKRVISKDNDTNTIRVNDANTGAELQSFPGHTAFIKSVEFSPDGKQIVSGSYDKTVRLWDARTSKEKICIVGHNEAVTSVAISPDGKRIASVSGNTLKIWDADSGVESYSTQIRTLSHAYSVAFSPDNKHIVIALGNSGFSSVNGVVQPRDNSLRIWDIDSKKEIHALFGHSYAVLSAAFSPDGKQIVSCADESIIKIWDVETGFELRSLEGHKAAVDAISYSPNGKQILSACSNDFTIRIWDAFSGQEQKSLKVEKAASNCNVLSAMYSPSGDYIISSYDDNTIRIWDVLTGEVIQSIEDQLWGVRYAAFHPDGSCLLSVSNNAIHIWDSKTGKKIQTLLGHTDTITAAFFSPDGNSIVSASWDKTIRIWSFPPLQELIDQTRERFKDRSLTPEERKQYYLD